jgi:hypothetical protein
MALACSCDRHFKKGDSSGRLASCRLLPVDKCVSVRACTKYDASNWLKVCPSRPGEPFGLMGEFHLMECLSERRTHGPYMR